MTIRLFVASAGTLIFAWLVTTYFWSVPIKAYGTPSVSGEVVQKQVAVVATSAEASPHALTTEATGVR